MGSILNGANISLSKDSDDNIGIIVILVHFEKLHWPNESGLMKPLIALVQHTGNGSEFEGK